MNRYSNPQRIWDRWVESRDSLLEREANLADQNQDTTEVRKTIRMLWEVTKEDLKLAAIIKFLEIDA